MRIHDLFQKAKQEKRSLFIPYITAGDPELKITAELVQGLAAQGADLIELGVPFSDPLADGATNQLAALRALKQAVSLKDCCLLVQDLRSKGCQVPLVLFTYFNPILKLGVEAFAKLAASAGVDAVLVVDLPLEEAKDFAACLRKQNLGIILLISPTTTALRIKQSADLLPEFLYYISQKGVTGARKTLSESLEAELAFVRSQTDLPLAVGFGISTPEQVKAVAKLAEGVIVGSVLVKEMEAENPLQGMKNLLQVSTKLIGALKPFSSYVEPTLSCVEPPPSYAKPSSSCAKAQDPATEASRLILGPTPSRGTTALGE